MDEKNLENEMQEEPVVQEEQPVEEKPIAQEEQPVEEKPITQEEQPVEEKPIAQEEQPVQEESAVQEEQSVEEEEIGQTDKLVRVEQPDQESQTFQPAYNAYGDVMPAASVATSETPAPKKKKGLKIALISVICAAVVGVVALVIFLFTRKTPEEMVKLAVTNTFDELQDTDFNIYEDIFGLSQYNMDDIDVEMSFSIDEVMDMIELNGSNVSIEASVQKIDEDTTNFDMLTQLTIADKTLSTNLYYLQDIFYLEMPEILNSVISLDSTDIDLSEYAVPETEEDKEIEELYDTYMIPARKELQEAITYEKIDKVKITTHNDKSVNTTQYQVTVPVSAVKAYLQTECDYLVDCTDRYLSEDEVQDALGISRDEFKQIATQLPNYFNFLFTRDFVFTFYIRDEKLVRTEFSYKFSLIGATLDVSADFMGDDYVLSDVYATCDITIGDEVIGLVGTYKQNSGSDELNTDAAFSVIYEDVELINCNYNENFNVGSGAYHKIVTVSGMEELANATYEVRGKIYDIVKGEGFKADFDSITVSYKDSELIKCSAKFAMGNLGKNIAEPDYSSVISFSEIDDSIMDKILDSDKLEDIFSAWEEAFGADDLLSTFPEDDPFDEEYPLVDSDEGDQDPFGANDDKDIVLSNGKYQVEIHEPNAYSRTWANSSEIDLDNGTYSVYISLEEVTDKEDKCSEFLAYYDYFGSDCEILEQSMQTAVLPDGTEIDCYVISVVLYGSDITDMFFFYPLEGDDYVLCNVEAWEADADIQAAVEEIVNDDVIRVK